MSLAGGKTKPEDLFTSLKVLKKEAQVRDESLVARRLFERMMLNATNPELAQSLLSHDEDQI